MGGSVLGDEQVSSLVSQVLFKGALGILVSKHKTGAQILVRADSHDAAMVLELDHSLVVEVGEVRWLSDKVLPLAEEVEFEVCDSLFNFWGSLLELEI